AVVCVVLTITVRTVVARLPNRLSRLCRTVCAMAIMVAWAVPSVTGTYVFVWLFEPLNGFVSTVLSKLGLVDPSTLNWFTDRLSFFTIATMNVVHHGFPFIAITVLAGLMSVPKELYEAATIDGASAWNQSSQDTVP